MDKLKEILFEHALMYHSRMTNPDAVDIAFRNFCVLYNVIIEAGLDEEFQQYKKEREESEE